MPKARTTESNVAAQEYSVIPCTLGFDGGDGWKNPREVLEEISQAGYEVPYRSVGAQHACRPHSPET